RLNTTTSWPALARCPAIGAPMTPRPMNATLAICRTSPLKSLPFAHPILTLSGETMLVNPRIGNGSMAGANARPIIIKRIKKAGHGGHHGGAWKVAYADFVTAMMAFFLLMWLINTTSPDQRRGIAEFFAPASVSRVSSGAGGLLEGTSFAES